MEITVRGFCGLCVDSSFQKIKLFDCDIWEDVWEGFADEIPEEYEEWYICSWDCTVKDSETLTLNISKK